MTPETTHSFSEVAERVAVVFSLCAFVLLSLVLVAYGILAVLVFRPHKSAPSYYRDCTDMSCTYVNTGVFL